MSDSQRPLTHEAHLFTLPFCEHVIDFAITSHRRPLRGSCCHGNVTSMWRHDDAASFSSILTFRGSDDSIVFVGFFFYVTTITHDLLHLVW